MPVARGDEIAAIAIVQFFGDLFARTLLGPVLRERGEKIARDLGPHAFAQQAHGRARPLGITHRHERQIEQPLAGIVDDPDREARRVPGNRADESSQRACRRKADFDADLAHTLGRRRPVRDRHLLDIVAIGKGRQSVGAGARDSRRDQPALADHAEQRHAVGIVRAAQKVVDEARHEHGLAGAAQARHREGNRRAAGKLAEAEPLGGLREDRREPAQIQHGRHTKPDRARSPRRPLDSGGPCSRAALAMGSRSRGNDSTSVGLSQVGGAMDDAAPRIVRSAHARALRS